jgi:hypothetical protein
MGQQHNLSQFGHTICNRNPAWLLRVKSKENVTNEGWFTHMKKLLIGYRSLI